MKLVVLAVVVNVVCHINGRVTIPQSCRSVGRARSLRQCKKMTEEQYHTYWATERTVLKISVTNWYNTLWFIITVRTSTGESPYPLPTGSLSTTQMSCVYLSNSTERQAAVRDAQTGQVWANGDPLPVILTVTEYHTNPGRHWSCVGKAKRMPRSFIGNLRMYTGSTVTTSQKMFSPSPNWQPLSICHMTEFQMWEY